MATRVSIEGTGPSYASVLNLGGVESNKENIESTESVVETPPRHDNEEEEGFVPVISHTRRPAKHRRDRERRAQPRPPKAPQASHTDSQPAADQAQSSEDQPKKFVEAPIPKVNPSAEGVLECRLRCRLSSTTRRRGRHSCLNSSNPSRLRHQWRPNPRSRSPRGFGNGRAPWNCRPRWKTRCGFIIPVYKEEVTVNSVGDYPPFSICTKNVPLTQ
ncbi:unnamed protein product [Leptidea sinapis]|uniref:Uncharacterized protein n=1 Tax=Leptidea sinapis TaxID=189913 RepID=A0A5E4PZY0_9NEOP|nr:unnamed protein product [Leptidea sinapis]